MTGAGPKANGPDGPGDPADPADPGASSASIERILDVIAAELEANRLRLNELDGAAGDGDLGITAGTAAAALREIGPSLAGRAAAECLASIGMTLARRVPSTGGTLAAFACLAAGRAGSPPAGTTATARAATLLEAARDEIARRGKVGPGDRTMLDALAPAAEALRAAAETGRSVAEGLAAAALAADAGAAATAGMAAVTGRAGWLADRAKGHEDAGARLAAIVLAALSRALVPAATDGGS